MCRPARVKRRCCALRHCRCIAERVRAKPGSRAEAVSGHAGAFAAHASEAEGSPAAQAWISPSAQVRSCFVMTARYVSLGSGVHAWLRYTAMVCHRRNLNATLG